MGTGNLVMKRIQRKRTKGFRMPPNTVYVGRPTIWGNPLKIYEVNNGGLKASRKEVVEGYRHLLEGMGESELREFLKPLRGKNLACWCKLSQECHADILIEYVKAWEKMGLFDSTLEELQKRNAKRSIELLTKAMNITREPKQITLEVFQ
jgi:hypothetical protein